MQRERLHRSILVHLARRAEDRPAELHAALDDARTVVADDPLQRVVRKRLRIIGGRVEQRDLVEQEANFGVRGVGEAIEPAEQGDVRCREGGVGLELLEEDN